jgi:L-2,4-diaminobutyrate decarboxylase
MNLDFLGEDNIENVKNILTKTIERCLQFKIRSKVNQSISNEELKERYLDSLPLEGINIEALLSMVDALLEDSVNFSSPKFLGFPDAGNSVAGLMGGIIEGLSQQNLLNSKFCGRAATFIECCTVNWLRELVGYPISESIQGIKDLGGIATTGGTCSNMYALLMARQRAYPNSFTNGIDNSMRSRSKILIASDITHYSVAAAVGLLGLGTDSILRIPTSNFRYDIAQLQNVILECKSRGDNPICIVLNAGDSRTQSIDDLQSVINLVRKLIPDCWIHIDACHGCQLLFSDRYRDRIHGIELADSVTLDPHKVLNVPYVISYYLFKDIKNAENFWVSSSLIMDDPWSLGQLTPNIGSKSWSSIKLYLFVKALGFNKIKRMIDQRIDLAARFRQLICQREEFQLLTKRSDINSVPFVFVSSDKSIRNSAKTIFELNKSIYEHMLQDGVIYLHGFPIRDDSDMVGFGTDNKVFALRYMCGNPRTSESDLIDCVNYILKIGTKCLQQFQLVNVI